MVGSRGSMLFWHESWVDGMVLKECFSILFSLVVDKNVIVKNSVLDWEVEVEKKLVRMGGGVSSWRSVGFCW